MFGSFGGISRRKVVELCFSSFGLCLFPVLFPEYFSVQSQAKYLEVRFYFTLLSHVFFNYDKVWVLLFASSFSSANSILMVAFTVAGVARTTSTIQQQQPRP